MEFIIHPNGQEITVQLIGLLDTTTITEQADELQKVLDITDQALVISE